MRPRESSIVRVRRSRFPGATRLPIHIFTTRTTPPEYHSPTDLDGRLGLNQQPTGAVPLRPRQIPLNPRRTYCE